MAEEMLGKEVLRNPIFDTAAQAHVEDDPPCPFPGCDNMDCDVHRNLQEF